MWIIAGLGNPGAKYAPTRHNVGFRVVDHLAAAHGIPFEEKELYYTGKGSIEGRRVVLLKPLTYMNRSGLAVKRALKRAAYGAEDLSETLIVVHDDLDLETGVLKIRKNGSSGGHRGIESIIQETGTREFIRVKIGIGRDRELPVETYVLRPFRGDEFPVVKDAIIRASDAVAAIIKDGVETAMNRYNRAPRASGPRASG